MARLLEWPAGLPVNYREPLSGPRTIGSGVTTSIGGFTQTVSSPLGAWRWRFQFSHMRGQMARRYRGWITALHGGANATRVPFCDWDGLSFDQMGVQTTRQAWRLGQPWSNGEPWSNGKNWGSTPPEVPVAQPTPFNGTEVYLSDADWGHRLGMGDMIGFFPHNLGLYEITQVFAPGHYRVWPPLRKALTTDDEATLFPTLAMRLENEDAATAPRDAHFITNASVVMVEVFDYDCREYFNDVTPYTIQPQPAPSPTTRAIGNFANQAYMRDGKAVTASEAWSLERASHGTYFDASGVMQTAAADELRFDHDPVTGEALGALIEGATTNLSYVSEQLDHSLWNKLFLSVEANQAPAPDGSNGMDKVIQDDTMSSKQLYQGRGKDAVREDYTLAWFLKAAEEHWAYIFMQGDGSSNRAYAWFDLSAGVPGTFTQIGGFDTHGSGMRHIGGGVYRCWVSALTDAVPQITGGIGLANKNGTPTSFQGDGVSGIEAWGAQLAKGDSLSSYIKTGGSSVTRAADTLTLKADGTNNWTITFDDDSEQMFSGVTGDLALTRADINRAHIKSYRAETA